MARKEQLDSVRSGAAVRLSEEGTDIVVLRNDVFERLRGSPHDYLEWCQNWVRPSRNDSATVPTAEALFRLAQSRSEAPKDESGTVVPAAALRRLRLRRLARATPLRRKSAISELVRIDAAQEPEREAAIVLVDAVRRWYANRGAQDGTVQSNLARLAILR